MRSVILYCPHLNRDVRGLLAAVPHPHIYTGMPTPRGEDGCLNGHHEIVRGAMRDGVSSVFVMEDDCEFTPEFSFARWSADAEWAQSHGYDVLVGGCTRTYDERVAREGLIEVSAFHSAHCLVYFASGFEKVLRTVQPHDVSIGRCGARAVLTHPFVAVQRASHSGVLRRDVDYVPLYAAHEQRLGRALGLTEPFVPSAMEAY